MAVLQSLRNAVRVPGLRNRLLFTAAMLVVLRVGAVVSVPGVNLEMVDILLAQGGLLGYLDLFSGGAFRVFAIFAMGVTPYINASIIMQLLTIVIPRLEEMQKEGQEGRKKIQQWTRYLTVGLGLVQSFGFGIWLKNYGAFLNNNWTTLFVIMISLTAGTAFLMWLGEMITEKGIGNGMSVIIFANIIAGLPPAIVGQFSLAKVGAVQWWKLALIAAVAAVVIGLVIYITEGLRKIPVEYGKRVVGRQVYGGQRTHLPLKINQAGVIPVIFAQSLLMFPATIGNFLNDGPVKTFITTWLTPGQGMWFWVLNAVLIIFFTYFYISVTFKPDEIADNLKKQGGFIPGYRPGKPTADYLSRVSERLTIVGALFLAALVVVPTLLVQYLGIPGASLGGTALLIVVGVVIETMKQVESQLVVRKYQGFMRS